MSLMLHLLLINYSANLRHLFDICNILELNRVNVNDIYFIFAILSLSLHQN
jgi:hypothetical protein